MTDKRPTREEAEAAVRTLLSWMGEDPERKGLKRTPMRVLKCYDEWFGGYAVDPSEQLGSTFADAAGYNDIVALCNIDFESHCEHHIAPFIGKAHVAYLPADNVVGVSKLVKVVNAFAKRLQVQEKMTHQIGECINDALKPRAVAVIIEAQHECMTTRGVYKRDIQMVTSSFHGEFETNAELKAEFLRIIDREKR